MTRPFRARLPELRTSREPTSAPFRRCATSCRTCSATRNSGSDAGKTHYFPSYDLNAMKGDEHATRSLEIGTGRVEAFSDSVMAVIITIMAFELRPPRGTTLDAVR